MIPDNQVNIPDEKLLDACLKGEQWAWEEFFKRFKHIISWAVKGASAIFSSINDVKLSKEDLKECEQFVWNSFLEKECYKLRRWQKKCLLARWLKVCGSQSAGNFFRSKKNVFFEEPYDVLPDPSKLMKDPKTIDPQKEVEKKDLLEKIQQIINYKLPEQDRLFATFYWEDNLSYKEISRIMNINTNKLHIRKHRIIKKVSKEL